MGNQRHVTRATKLIDITKEFDGSLIAIVSNSWGLYKDVCLPRTNEKISVACG